MPVIANLERPIGLGRRKVEVITATGPATAVSVGAASTVDVSISISPSIANVEEVVVESISGLPGNVLASQVGFTATTVTLRAVNPTANVISIGAGSLTIRLIVIGY